MPIVRLGYLKKCENNNIAAKNVLTEQHSAVTLSATEDVRLDRDFHIDPEAMYTDKIIQSKENVVETLGKP